MLTSQKKLFAFLGIGLIILGFLYYYPGLRLPAVSQINWLVVVVSLAAFTATFLGGLLALRFKDKLHLILGFSAGAVIGVAFFDLIPEAIELSEGFYDVDVVASVIALGFVAYLLFDRFIGGHSHTAEECCAKHNHTQIKRGVLKAGSISVHSFLDGMAIGLAFQVAPEVGAVVAVAVLIHHFSDGLNTVNMITRANGSKKLALRWLAIDSLAPAMGVLSTLFFTVSQPILGVVLALFAGSFLYIGAADLLPESHHNHPTWWTTISTVLGILVLYFAIQLAGV